MNQNIDAAVAKLLAAREGGAAVTADFVSAHPLSISDGLEVRSRVQAALGPIGGWKISPASTSASPNYGPIFAKDVHGASARFARNAFRKTGVECEIAFRIGRDLTAPPYNRDQVADAIESLVPLMEICDSRLVDHKVASEGWRLADFSANGAILVGPAVEHWRAIDTHEQPVKLTFNGKTVAEVAGNPTPDLVAVVQLLANQAVRHCGGVRAGQIVTTGSMSGNIAAGPGVEAIAHFAKLGELRVTLEN